MAKDEKKKGLMERWTGVKKEKKTSCCGNYELEEIPEEEKKD